MSKSENKYLSIDPDIEENLKKLADKNEKVTIHYMAGKDHVKTKKGTLVDLTEKDKGVFLEFEDEGSIRADKVVTINGKPGPSYDLYNSFADACLQCHDSGQFE